MGVVMCLNSVGLERVPERWAMRDHGSAKRQDFQSQGSREEAAGGSVQTGRQNEGGARPRGVVGAGIGGGVAGVAGGSDGAGDGRGPSRYKEETLLLRPRVREVLV